MMEACELEPGMIVGLNDKAKPSFKNRYMVIEDPKSWGAQGYIIMPDGIAYYRAEWDEMDLLEKE